MFPKAYFFADLHLSERGAGAERLRSVCDCLDRLLASHTASSLCFLGDTLDFSCGYDALRPSAFFDRVARFVAQGVQVAFLTGNHDPALSPRLVQLGAQIWEPGVHTFGALRIYLAHGDLEIAQGKRKWLCELARSAPLLKLVRLVPESWATPLALLYAERPQKHRRPFVRFQTLALCRALQARLRGQADLVLCGHLHCPLFLPSQGDLPALRVLGPWGMDAQTSPFALVSPLVIAARER